VQQKMFSFFASIAEPTEWNKNVEAVFSRENLGEKLL
jgi:hypothetical protein